MNAPSLRVQCPFDDDDQEQARVPIKWVDIFEGRAEENKEKDTRPWLKSTQRSNKIAVFDQCAQKASQKIKKKCVVLLSNTVMPITFEILKLGKQWPGIKTSKALGLIKWRKQKSGGKRKKKNATRVKTSITLMFEIKIVEDPQALLHVGVGRLPDWLQNNKGLDTWTDEVCVFSYLAVHRGAHRQHSTKENHVLAESFLWLLLLEDVKFAKGISPLPKTTFSRALLDTRLMPKVPSR